MEHSKAVLLKKLGSHIKEIRKSKNMTQKELAFEIGKDTQAIERLERGGTNPTYIFLIQVAEGLNISITELLDVK